MKLKEAIEMDGDLAMFNNFEPFIFLTLPFGSFTSRGRQNKHKH